MKTYRIIVLLLIPLLNNCGMPDGQKKYLESLKPAQPSPKELKYIEKLEKAGYFNIEMHIPIPGLHAKSSYDLDLGCHFNATQKNKDSIERAGKEIANELYGSIIADSILFGCSEIEVKFYVPKSEMNPFLNMVIVENPIESLQQRNHFRVVQISERKYKREKL